MNWQLGSFEEIEAVINLILRFVPIVLDAPRTILAQRCQGALQRMRATLIDIDLDAGYIKARKHYFYNLYKMYFDEITITIQPVADNQYMLSLRSDGIIPTLRSDKRRNEANLRRLITYITS